MNKRIRNTVTVTAALGAAAVLLTGAQAAPAAAEPPCPPGAVCLWPEPGFQGEVAVWTPEEGNVFLGDKNAELVDHVGSFVSHTDACLQDSPTPPNVSGSSVPVNNGQVDEDFYLEYGRWVDRIRPRPC